MSIHPHLPGIVKACADKPDTFINLIHMVSLYMRIYTVIYISSFIFRLSKPHLEHERMILQNYEMGFLRSCLKTQVHILPASFLSYSKTHSSRGMTNHAADGLTLKLHFFSSPNVIWRTSRWIQSMYIFFLKNL